MKQNRLFHLIIFVATTIVACNSTDFKRTRSGLLYKLFPGNNKKDSLPKQGDVLKFNVTTKLNDSVLFSSYDQMPGFARVPSSNDVHYSPAELFGLLREGDSLISVSLVDSFLKKGIGEQLPPTAKPGDRIITTFKVIKVFRNDSIAQLDYNAEMKKDEPRRNAEAKEQQAKADKERKEQESKDIDAAIKSGDAEKQIKQIEAYLASKKITATKTGNGVFVHIDQLGDGPQADSGKYVTVKYSGKRLVTDSVFQANSYKFPLGNSEVIAGWDQGLKLFKKGGKGTLYVPGFLAYGKNPPQGSAFTIDDPLIFDVEIVDVTDN